MGQDVGTTPAYAAQVEVESIVESLLDTKTERGRGAPQFGPGDRAIARPMPSVEQRVTEAQQAFAVAGQLAAGFKRYLQHDLRRSRPDPRRD